MKSNTLKEKKYVYILLDSNEKEPRWAGQTNDPVRRYKEHKLIKKKSNPYLTNWINQIARENYELIMEVVFETYSQEECNQRECQEIKKIRQKIGSRCVNISAGGLDTRDWHPSEYTKKLISEALKGRPNGRKGEDRSEWVENKLGPYSEEANQSRREKILQQIESGERQPVQLDEDTKKRANEKKKVTLEQTSGLKSWRAEELAYTVYMASLNGAVGIDVLMAEWEPLVPDYEKRGKKISQVVKQQWDEGFYDDRAKTGPKPKGG